MNAPRERQDFRREWGPEDNGEAPPDRCVFELSNGYIGRPTPSGLIPHVTITYYVQAYEADETNQPSETGPLWSVDEVDHTYLAWKLNDWVPA